MKSLTLAALLLGPSLLAPALLLGAETYTCAPAKNGAVALNGTSAYSATSAGFDLRSTPQNAAGFCSSDKPFFLSIPVAEGNYRVTVELGSPTDSVTTVRAEARRLMLEKIATAAGKTTTRTFDVSVRTPQIGSDEKNQVRLKPREVGNADWDHKLTLEFNGQHPGFRSVRIEAIPNPASEPVIYLAGDSTVVDQDVEPWTAWGQILPRFFAPGVVISNQAESGETVRSFGGEKRFEKIFSTIKTGDYLFLQFGHNDQKPESKVTLDIYQELLTQAIARARAAGATPVLVTSMLRRNFLPDGTVKDTMAGYPDRMRLIAKEQNVTLIDLNAMSRTLWEALGPDGTKKAFMHYEANSFPGQTEAILDDTHFNGYGAYELAECIVRGMREANLPLTKYLIDPNKNFDPKHPDDPATFSLPFTPIPSKDGDVTKVPQI
jgi:lysophospholipase L1-like esterase